MVDGLTWNMEGGTNGATPEEDDAMPSPSSTPKPARTFAGVELLGVRHSWVSFLLDCVCVAAGAFGFLHRLSLGRPSETCIAFWVQHSWCSQACRVHRGRCDSLLPACVLDLATFPPLANQSLVYPTPKSWRPLSTAKQALNGRGAIRRSRGE